MHEHISKKEKRKILKQLGIDIHQKKTPEDIANSIEEGKNKHRVFVQEMKNREIMKNLSPEKTSEIEESFTNYIGQPVDYSGFNSFVAKPNWKDE